MTILKTIEGLPGRHRDGLGEIAVGQDRGHPARVLTALLKKGLIETFDEPMPGWPQATVRRYAVPTPVHIAWCTWCETHAEDQPR